VAKLIIVGVGPGSKDYVTPAAQKTVQQADLVVGAQRSLALFTSQLKGESVVLTAKNLSQTLKQAADAVKTGKNVALLSTGDPGFSGLLHTVQESGLFASADVAVVAGVSSIQACAARLAISWEDACLFTFHEGKVSAAQKKQLLGCLKKGKTAMLLPDAKAFSPRKIADFLTKSGLDKKTQIFICENLTLENEKVSGGTLERFNGETIGALCVMVIKPNRQNTRKAGTK
jgi:cobalt-precorrin-7 (C5)-methyltransferase